MNPSPKPVHLPLALAFILIGGALLILVRVVAFEDPLAHWLVWGTGFASWMAGCFHMALAKGLSASFGFLGVFFIVGLILIFLIAKKQPEMARAAARKKAANPDGEYRGDPTSPY